MIDLTQYDIGEHRVPCPFCSKNPRDKTLGVTVRAIGDALAHCFRCDYRQHERTKRHYTPTIKPSTRPLQKHTTLSDWGHGLWAQCQPLSGTAIEYLRHRKCLIPPVDGDLRWHPALTHKPSNTVGAALVALVTDFVTAEPRSLHRTWITPTGKANVEPNRMLLGGHAAQGGVVRLYPDEAVTTGLGLAEGIETALSLAHEYQPVWAAISAGNLGGLPLLDGVESLMVAVDTDDAGQRAYQSIASRWTLAGKEVYALSVQSGDVNDHVEVHHG